MNDSDSKTATTSPAEPSVWKWAFKVAGAAGLTAMLCCVAPMVLFMLGLAGGIWAISFTEFFYAKDEQGNTVDLWTVWLLRGGALAIAITGLVLFRRRQNQCSIDPARGCKNLILAAVAILLLGVSIYLGLDRLSSWYFTRYVSKAQQAEYEQQQEADDNSD